MSSRPLSLSPMFRGIREQILTKASAKPICPDCGEEVEPSGWAVHRNQMCSRRLVPTTPRTA